MSKELKDKINSVHNSYKAFAYEYLNNNFHGSAAYCKVYGVSPDVGSVEAVRVLSSPSFVKPYSEVLSEIGYDISEEWVKQEIVNLFKTGKKEATKGRMLELLSKIKGLYKDSNQSVAVFTGLDAKEKAIVASRLLPNSIEATDSVEVVVEKKT